MAKKNIDLAKLNSKKLNNELENYKIINSNLRTQVCLLLVKHNNLLTSFKDFEKKINDVSFQNR